MRNPATFNFIDHARDELRTHSSAAQDAKFFTSGATIKEVEDVYVFFKAACNAYWKSGRTNTVMLEEEDPKAFALFLTWLTTGDITNCLEYIEITGCETQNDRAHLTLHTKQKQQLQDCYFLGEYLMSTGFKNGTMDVYLSMLKMIHCVHNKTPRFSAKEITSFYTYTSHSSTLRRFLQDLALSIPSEDFDEMIMSRFAELKLVQDVAKQLQLQLKDAEGIKQFQMPWDKDFCHYHEHPGAAEGYSCTK
ncbi:hypothetical protein VTL71DRAFT_5188 [Oculimacula yallundae]|uniref:BTB domain-containing protein n=1 Tax=Oculimacula yallundae TaxID=86028 RepID=A0ABR4C2X3_9HELO